MKISRVTPHLVDRALIVRVHTDEGITGTGEAGLWAHHRHVATAIEDLGEYFVGKDAGRIEHHFQAVTRDAHFGGPVLAAALSAIDVALWDILGKATGQPVHQFLGGKCRDEVRVFASIGGDTVEDHVAKARKAVAEGYTSLRVMPFLPGWEEQPPTSYIGSAAEIVGAVRDAVGEGIDLGVELHRNFGPDEAIMLAREIAPLRILYLEDPVAPESLEALRYVADHIDIPIAAGERCHSLFGFSELLATRAAAWIRPDPSLAGGFTQCRKIAGMAEASFVKVFPHLMGSQVNLAAFVQFGAAIPNYALMEGQATILDDIVDQPLVVEDGYVTVPDRPGIGVDLLENELKRFPFRDHPIAPPTRADGSIAH
jgi:galactonate dehydratase